MKSNNLFSLSIDKNSAARAKVITFTSLNFGFRPVFGILPKRSTLCSNAVVTIGSISLKIDSILRIAYSFIYLKFNQLKYKDL